MTLSRAIRAAFELDGGLAGDLPVTFTPKDDAAVERLSKATGFPEDLIKARCEQLHEANPMLGHRGCRLCITFPEILEMQVRAIIEAAVACQKKGIKAIPEIMHPLVLDRKELKILEEQTRKVADEIIKKSGVKLAYLVGTMIEIPRGALTADEIATVAEFFSFGTNDLTQTTLGVSRDDAARFHIAWIMHAAHDAAPAEVAPAFDERIGP